MTLMKEIPLREALLDLKEIYRVNGEEHARLYIAQLYTTDLELKVRRIAQSVAINFSPSLAVRSALIGFANTHRNSEREKMLTTWTLLLLAHWPLLPAIGLALVALTAMMEG